MLFNTNLATAVYCFENTENRRTMDERIKEYSIVEQFSEFEKIIYTAVKGIMIVSDRDSLVAEFKEVSSS